MRRWVAASVVTMLGVAAVVAGASSEAARAQTERDHHEHAVRTDVPTAPFVESVISEGLAVLANWSPDAPSEHVTRYTLQAAVAKGYEGGVPTGCASPRPVYAPPSDSSALVGGVCAHVPYTVTMTATSAAGTSGRSRPSNPAVPLPAQPPSQPVIVQVFGRNSSLVVAWSPPSLTGGRSLTGYTLEAKVGKTTVTTHPGATATQAVIAGLSNGTHYQVTLTATSAAGTSKPARSSGRPSTAYLPGQPQSFEVSANGSGGLTAKWVAPADDGGDAIQGYLLTIQQEVPDGSGGWDTTGSPSTETAPATATSATITGLTADDFYSVSLAGVTAAGIGDAATTNPPVSPTTGLQPGAVELTSATMDALASDSDGALTWTAPVPSQVQAVTAGNVLVGPASMAAPDGLLVKVSSVHTGSAGAEVLDTTTASLTDAFSDLSAAFSGDPSELSDATFTPDLPGVRFSASQRADQSGPRSINISPSFGLSVSLQGGPDDRDSVSASLTFTPHIFLDAEITQGFLGIPDGASVAASASIAVKAALSASVSKSFASWEIGDLKFPTFPIGPLEVEPEIPLTLDLSGSISVGVQASVTLGAGFSWSTADPGSLNTTNLSTPPQLVGGPVPGPSASFTGALTLKVPLGLLIYGIGGPDLEADGILAMTLSPTGNPWFEISPTVACRVGLLIDINIGPFSYDNGINVTLATADFPAFEIGAAPDVSLVLSPPDATVVVGRPRTMSAVGSDGKSYPVLWALQGAAAGDAINSSGVLSVVAPAGRTLTVIAVAGNGAEGQTTVSVKGVPDPPSDVSTALDTAGTAATISWGSPASDGGYPLQSYTVVTTPATTTRTVPESVKNVTLTGLSLGSFYSVAVYATNSGELTSGAATAFINTPQPGSLTSSSAQQLPLPPNASATEPEPQLTDLACSAAGSCVAVGNYFLSDGTGALLIEVESGGTWKAVEAGLPAGGYLPAGVSFQGVACPTSGACVAVGTYFALVSDSTYPESFVGTISNSGVWKPSEAPVPANADGVNAQPFLTSVACASDTCTAVGSYVVTTTGDFEGLAERYADGAWTPTEVPAPSNSTGTEESLEALDCPTTAYCMASLTYTVASGTAAQFEIDDNGAWSPVTIPLPAGVDNMTTGPFHCVAAGECTEMGDYAIGSTLGVLVESLADGAWTPTEAPEPANAYGSGNTIGDPSFLSVGCTPAGVCTGNGQYTDEGFGIDGIFYSVSAGTVTQVAVPPPLQPDLYPYGQLGFFSCQGAGALCVGLGDYANAGMTFSGSLVVSGTPGHWIGAPAPVPANTVTPYATTLYDSALSCPGGNQCFGVGSYLTKGANPADQDNAIFVQKLGFAG